MKNDGLRLVLAFIAGIAGAAPTATLFYEFGGTGWEFLWAYGCLFVMPPLMLPVVAWFLFPVIVDYSERVLKINGWQLRCVHLFPLVATVGLTFAGVVIYIKAEKTPALWMLPPQQPFTWEIPHPPPQSGSAISVPTIDSHLEAALSPKLIDMKKGFLEEEFQRLREWQERFVDDEYLGTRTEAEQKEIRRQLAEHRANFARQVRKIYNEGQNPSHTDFVVTRVALPVILVAGFIVFSLTWYYAMLRWANQGSGANAIVENIAIAALAFCPWFPARLATIRVKQSLYTGVSIVPEVLLCLAFGLTLFALAESWLKPGMERIKGLITLAGGLGTFATAFFFKEGLVSFLGDGLGCLGFLLLMTVPLATFIGLYKLGHGSENTAAVSK